MITNTVRTKIGGRFNGPHRMNISKLILDDCFRGSHFMNNLEVIEKENYSILEAIDFKCDSWAYAYQLSISADRQNNIMHKTQKRRVLYDFEIVFNLLRIKELIKAIKYKTAPSDKKSKIIETEPEKHEDLKPFIQDLPSSSVLNKYVYNGITPSALLSIEDLASMWCYRDIIVSKGKRVIPFISEQNGCKSCLKAALKGRFKKTCKGHCSKILDDTRYKTCLIVMESRDNISTLIMEKAVKEINKSESIKKIIKIDKLDRGIEQETIRLLRDLDNIIYLSSDLDHFNGSLIRRWKHMNKCLIDEPKIQILSCFIGKDEDDRNYLKRQQASVSSALAINNYKRDILPDYRFIGQKLAHDFTTEQWKAFFGYGL